MMESFLTKSFFITLPKILIMKYLSGFLILLFILGACARVGRPTGGDKDVTPPKLLSSIPKQGATGFKGHEIVLYFDEYVTLKAPEKNILISPPLNNMPVIKPAGIASKVFKIIFKDSLLPNTTYQINFGESIADYNEGNKLDHLQLVFSTGKTIDSLSLKGRITPVHYEKKTEKILVGLYPAQTFKDSMVFNTKPFYVGMTNKEGLFNLTHLKAGEYVAVAIEDANGDYKYRIGEEGIGFLSKPVILPKDSVANIKVFREPLPFSIEKITQKSKNHVVINYKGPKDSLKVNLKMPVSDFILQKVYQKADLWYQTGSDSIKIEIPIKNRLKKYARKRIKDTDSLQVSIQGNGRINPLDTVQITGTMPLIAADTTKIVLKKDSLLMPFSVATYQNKFLVIFDKKTGQNYQLTILPKAVTGFLGQKNKDTLTANIKIPKLEKYGTLLLHLKNNKPQPVFVEVIKNKKIFRKTPTKTTQDFTIKYLPAGKYKIRIVFDDNQNNRWDTGNYLKHQQAESTFEPPKPVEIRANWEVNQTYNLKQN